MTPEEYRVPFVIIVLTLATAYLYFGTGSNVGTDIMRNDIGQFGSCIFSGAVTGSLLFTQQSGSLSITGVVQGLKSGEHGFHIHQYGDLGDGCKACGGHYNPFGKQHGGPSDSDRHVGDLGNVEANSAGEAKISIVDAQPTLSAILGRSIVIHADADDLGRGGHEDSKTTGHAGARVACCVIGLAKQ